jgi:glycosyltransferase involved in cell wall biosynthesis
MKIINLSTNDFGGAGKAAVRIHQAQLKNGFDSLLYVKKKTTKLDSIIEIPARNYISSFNQLLKKILNRVFIYRKKYLMYSVNDYSTQNYCQKIIALHQKVDMIIIHWVAGFVGIEDLFELTKKYPNKVFWFSMDMAPITGGCHFSYECEEYKCLCKKCPADIWGLSQPQRNLARKKELFNSHSIKHIAPNKFVFSTLKKTYKSYLMYIPIDENIFFPKKKELENGALKLLFGSINLNDYRKGAHFFIKTMQLLNNIIGKEKIEIHLVGNDVPKELNDLSFKIVKHRYAKSEESLSFIYQQVDIFICCSVQDSGPMMVSEALMSGVPTIAYEVGICPEIIMDGVNGFLIKTRDIEAMANKILEVTNKKYDLQQMKLNARKSATEILSIKSNKGFYLTITSSNPTE